MSDKAIRNALRNARNVAKKPKADVDKYQKRYMRHIARTGMADGGAPAPQPNEMGFYSHGAYSAANLPQAKGTPQQFRAALEKQGVKPDEFLHTGWDDAFANRPSVTREEVAEHFTKNAPQINEVIKSSGSLYSTPEEWQAAITRAERAGNYNEAERLNLEWESYEGLGNEDAPKYQKYSIPGGENYREILMKSADPETLPPKFVVMGAFPREFDTREEAERYYNNITNLPEGTSEDIRAMIQRKLDRFPASIYEQPGEYKDPQNVYKSSHWKDPNILAHLRMSDRTGPNGEKILHVEEIQSDWAQQGREEGFRDDKIVKEAAELRHKMGQMTGDEPEYKQLWKRFSEIRGKGEGSTPLAPYVDKTDKWVDFALKRVLSEAAQGGYDGIAITPGSEQGKRYKLSRPVSKIQYFPTTQTLRTIDEDGAVDFERRNIKPEEISKHIGKQMANSLLSEENAIPNKFKEGILLHELRGEGMSIGGEGMRSFYDNIVPNQLNKMVQKMDKSAKVRMDHMPVSNQHDRLHYLLVTDAMREKIQRGLPTFAEGGEVESHDYKNSIPPTHPNSPLMPYIQSFMDQHQYGERPSADDHRDLNSKWVNYVQDAKNSSKSASGSNGYLIDAYHGTTSTKDFDKFKHSNDDIGMHFGTKNQANERLEYLSDWEGKERGARIIPVKLKIENPLFMPDQQQFLPGANREMADELSKIVEGFSDHFSGMAEGKYPSYAQMRQFLQKRGHDGIVYENSYEGRGGGLSYVVFDPRQVKSAISNNTFDPTDPNITKAEGGEVDRLDIDKYPTHYMPEVGRQVMADGGLMESKDHIPHDDPKRQENFANWFGYSHVVDESGNPVVLYHGTDADFDEFDPGKAGQTDHGWYGEGHYLTANPETASAYSGYKNYNAISGEEIHPGQNVMPVHVRLENPYYWPHDRPAATSKEEARKITEELRKQGYDGVIAPNKFEDDPLRAKFSEVVVFTPHQMKSATGNNGNYNMRSARLNEAAGGSVVDFAGPDSLPSPLSSTPTTPPSPPMLFFKPSKKEKIKTNEPTRPRSENSSVKKALMLTSSTLHGRAGRGTPR